MAPSSMATQRAGDSDLTDYLHQIERRSRRARRIGIGLVALVLAGAAAVGYVLATRKAPPRAWLRPLPAPTAKAFETGGVPLHEAAIDSALAQPLTDLVIQAGNARDHGTTEFARTLAKLRATDLGQRPKLVAAWQHALDAYGTAVSAAELGATDHDRDVLREAVKELTDQFAAAGLGYYLEGRIHGGYAYIQAYRLDEVVIVLPNAPPRGAARLLLRPRDRGALARGALVAPRPAARRSVLRDRERREFAPRAVLV